MTHALPWMPEECLGGPQVARPVARIVSDWARVWFAQTSWDYCADVWVPEAWPREGWTTLREEGAVALRGGTGAILRIAFAMLGEPECPNLTTRDLRLLRRIAGEALDDLVTRLKADLPVGGSSDHQELERWSLAIGVAGDPILHLSLDRVAVCLLARRTFAPVRSVAGLERPTAAVAEVPIPVAGQLGRASLALDQIGSLEPGDILLLDREAEDPIDLLVAGHKSALRCSIIDLDGVLSLKVCEPQ